MNYFGDPKFRKPHEEQIDTPIGAKCRHCGEPVVEGDTGTADSLELVLHYECGLRLAIGSVGHMKGLCSCFGGTEEDPPGMTRREAAIAAARYWHLQC